VADPCMTCETLRDRIRDLELAFVEQTARCAELACELEKAKARAVEWVRFSDEKPKLTDTVWCWDGQTMRLRTVVGVGPNGGIHWNLSWNRPWTHWAPLPPIPEDG
jgi:hypothetical protein